MHICNGQLRETSIYHFVHVRVWGYAREHVLATFKFYVLLQLRSLAGAEGAVVEAMRGAQQRVRGP